MSEIKIGDRFQGGTSASFEAMRPIMEKPGWWRVRKTAPGVDGHLPEVIEMTAKKLLELRQDNAGRRAVWNITTIGTRGGERASHRTPALIRQYSWGSLHASWHLPWPIPIIEMRADPGLRAFFYLSYLTFNDTVRFHERTSTFKQESSFPQRTAYFA
jgi:hypothetical protein